MGDAARTIPHIYATLENLQENHQSSMIKIEGTINNLQVSLLIDFKATFNYVNTKLVERCKLVGRKLHKHILAQLATWMKRKFIAVVKDCKFTMNGCIQNLIWT